MTRSLAVVTGLVAAHALVVALVAAALTHLSVAEWGYAAGGGPDPGGPSGALLGVALVPTIPIALLEVWAILRPCSPPRAAITGLGVLAAACFHGWIGSWQATLKFSGAGPVRREDVRWVAVDSTLIAAGHLALLMLLLLAWAAITRPGRAPA